MKTTIRVTWKLLASVAVALLGLTFGTLLVLFMWLALSLDVNNGWHMLAVMAVFDTIAGATFYYVHKIAKA